MEILLYPEVPRTVNTGKLYREARERGLPIVSVNALGRAVFERELSAEESSRYQSLLHAHEPRDLLAEERAAMLKAGITREAMLDALWQAAAEGDPAALLSLRAKMDAVKTEVRA